MSEPEKCRLQLLLSHDVVGPLPMHLYAAFEAGRILPENVSFYGMIVASSWWHGEPIYRDRGVPDVNVLVIYDKSDVIYGRIADRIARSPVSRWIVLMQGEHVELMERALSEVKFAHYHAVSIHGNCGRARCERELHDWIVAALSASAGADE